MDITCFHCKKTWEVPAGNVLAARFKFGLGFEEYTFVCPNCNSKNALTENEFKTAIRPQELIPVTGKDPDGGKATTEQPTTGVICRSAPTNPVPTPGPSAKELHGVVLVRKLDLQRDHHPRSETVASLHDGERVTILATWTDGENTWAQLGPERWAAIEQNGEARIELTDD